MYSVVACLTTQHDYRLVVLAALICAAAALTTFKIYSHVAASRRFQRTGLLLLTGMCAGSGIWATHFIAMLAYEPGVAAGYNAVITAISLLIAVVATTAGFAIASGGSAQAPKAGGCVIGAGIALMHYTGMGALIVPGALEWNPALIVASVALGSILAATALAFFHRTQGTRARLTSAALLTLAICGLHFIGMGAVTIVPDPTVAVHPSRVDGAVMALAVMAATLLVILSGITATALIESERRRQREQELNERGALMQAIIDNFPGGISLLNADLHIALINETAKKLLNLPDHLFAAGLPPVEDVFRFNANRGEYGPGDIDEHVHSRMALARAGQPHRFERERPDGTVIEVRGVPLAGGGFVTIYLDMTERRRSEAKIVHMAHHDALTDLPNRVLLRQRLEHALTGALRGRQGLAVLMVDLDRFKEVNDTLGHSVGDLLIRAVADRLRSVLREGSTIARLGGDEFAILDQVTDAALEATVLAERIQTALQTPFDLGDHQVVVGASIGIAIAPNDGTDADQILRNADLALYRCKADRHGTYCFFEPAMDARMRARRALEFDLRKAVQNAEFEVHYQPFVDLASNAVSGFEALLRWHHPERGLVSPAEFIPVAEENGLIMPIGEWVLRQACSEAANWPDHVRVAVNLSPAQFKNKNLVQMVLSALAASCLPANRLELEITESALLHNSAATVASVQQLRALGVQIAMDDFGTGYSSLAYLQSFPFDKIKIDRTFIHNLGNGSGALAILGAITTLAGNLGVPTIAEGVETQEQLEAVRAQGCCEAQGYLFSPARPASELKRLLLLGTETAQNAA